jgi:hypothetical protein
MKHLIFFCLIVVFVSCSQPDDFEKIPLEITQRETVADLDAKPAYLDVQVITKDTQATYVFSFEIQGEGSFRQVVPDKNGLICEFLNEQLMYGVSLSEDCAFQDYYSRYLLNGSKSGNFRLHVTVSGKVKKQHPDDLFEGFPMILDKIEKIESCPLTISNKPGEYPLENRFWKLVGFMDQNGKIISSPTCENPGIGIVFHDKLLIGTPLQDPNARSFTIESAVYSRPNQLFLVYGKTSENKLSITMAADPYWMPPRPATAQTNNFGNLTKGIYHKYDSLKQIFKFQEPVDFVISGNKLELHNSANGIRATFVTD